MEVDTFVSQVSTVRQFPGNLVVPGIVCSFPAARPPLGSGDPSGHLGEWLAAAVFDVQLEQSATAPGIDGVFRAGPLAGSTRWPEVSVANQATSASRPHLWLRQVLWRSRFSIC